ncbi:efflux RND transporter periplasmic adaptor subunit [Roseospira navarrensis]|nr:efflux RND transporter periplasmic adaptor subunit [Roseospira navarrensis]
MIGSTRFPALAGMLLVVVLTACDDPATPAAETGGEPRDLVRPARIAAVEPADRVEVHEFAARTKAVQVVDLSFRVAGLMEALPVNEGELVPEGTLIARLDPTPYERRVREAEVNLTSAQQDFERKRQLVSQNAVSQRAFDDAKNALDLAEVALEQARQDLDYTTLTAPFDAIVSRRLTETFTNVQAREPVVRLQDVSEIRVSADVPEYLIARHGDERGIDVEAVFPFLDDRTFPLSFREISTEADDVAQTYRVEYGMPRPSDVHILPGMTATMRAHVRRDRALEDALAIPPGALVPDGPSAHDATTPADPETTPEDTFFVWVVSGEDGAVSRRPVTLAHITNDTAFVTEGLTAGDRVVTAGVHHLRDGMRVRPLGEE